MNRHVISGMTPAFWRELQARDARRAEKPPHYFHISCRAYMMAHPLGASYPAIPHVDKPGKTYDVGRNKLKARLAALRKSRLAN